MTKSFCLSCGILLATAVSFAQEAPKAKQPPTGATNAEATLGPEAAPIQQVLDAYVDTFNKHDAKAIAALWVPKGIYIDRSTGERIEGREALQTDFASTFKEKPSARLSVTLKGVRFIVPDVASADGEAVEVPKDDKSDANKTSFSAIYVRHDGHWMIDSIQESDMPAPQAASPTLKDLEWLVGHWMDKSDQARVDTICRWSPRHAFLVRSFTIKSKQENDADQATEIIAWDPRTKQIRSWTFLSDGSFGEATWTRDGNNWTRKGTQTLSDGRSASGTQVISRVDDNTTTVELIADEIDGEPQPATDPLTVVRVPDDKPAATPESAPTDKEGKQ